MEQRKVTNRYSSLKSLLYGIRDSLIFASIILRFYTENKHRAANKNRENAYYCLHIVAYQLRCHTFCENRAIT